MLKTLLRHCPIDGGTTRLSEYIDSDDLEAETCLESYRLAKISAFYKMFTECRNYKDAH